MVSAYTKISALFAVCALVGLAQLSFLGFLDNCRQCPRSREYNVTSQALPRGGIKCRYTNDTGGYSRYFDEPPLERKCVTRIVLIVVLISGGVFAVCVCAAAITLMVGALVPTKQCGYTSQLVYPPPT